MSCLTLALHNKSVTVRMENGTFVSKISFEATLPRAERLCTVDGKEVRLGYVEFVAEKPGHETECLWFNDYLKDPDTGSITPPSLSFYALVSSDLFAFIRDAHPTSGFTLRLHTEFMGPIQFDDPLGMSLRWDTARQNPVPVQSYELTLCQQNGDV